MIVVNQTEGTLSRRFFAYLIDLVMIVLFSALLSLGIAFIGLLTLGLGWSLFAIVPPRALFTTLLRSAAPGRARSACG